MQDTYLVGIGRDPTLIAYCKPDLIITTNRVPLASDIHLIALNDFIDGNPYLAMYDTDLMQACQSESIEQVPAEVVKQFSVAIYKTIAAQAKTKQVVINPYYNAFTQRFRDLGFQVIGPQDSIAYEYSRKVVAYKLGQHCGVPVPQGSVVKGTSGIKSFIQSNPQAQAGFFIASDGDPYYPVNRHINTEQELNHLDDGINYLVTIWMDRVNSPNSQVLVGANQLLYLGLLDQIIKYDVKYYGNTFPSHSQFANQIKNYSLLLARAMQKDGYRGIVGFDWIETRTDCYLAEINPRKNRSTSMLINCLNHFRTSASPEIVELEMAASAEVDLPSFISSIPETLKWKMELYKLKQSALVTSEISPTYSESELFEQTSPSTSILNFPTVGTHLSPSVPDIARIVTSAYGVEPSTREAISHIESALKF